jgi:ABC-type hemin transport system ATPase subunit
MSTLLKRDTGNYKRGNGIEYMRHQEHEAQMNNLANTKGILNTLTNVEYKNRNLSQFDRATKLKEKEITY